MPSESGSQQENERGTQTQRPGSEDQRNKRSESQTIRGSEDQSTEDQRPEDQRSENHNTCKPQHLQATRESRQHEKGERERERNTDEVRARGRGRESEKDRKHKNSAQELQQKNNQIQCEHKPSEHDLLHEKGERMRENHRVRERYHHKANSSIVL